MLLDFDGICYRANVWLNGQQIANSDEMAGTFRQFEYDVTKAIAKDNELQVEVFRAQPGDPNTGFADWNPRPADESMGIWREVRVKTCGPVSVAHSAVRSRVNTETLDEAWLTIATELTNHTDKPVSGKITGTVEGQTFEYPITLNAHEKRSVALPSEIRVEHPRLWWCHNMGKPELYNMTLEFVADGKVTDDEQLTFGIREVKDYYTSEGFRGFMLNGKPVLIRGAGWTDDIFLRDTPETNELQVRYVRDMNLNCIRFENIWGTSQNVYDLCDRYGLLVLTGCL